MLQEVIEGKDDLYRRIHRNCIGPDGRIEYTAFMMKESHSETDPEISVDLARLTTPDLTLAKAPTRVRPKLGVGKLSAGVPIGLGMAVTHAPSKRNRAHAIIENTGSKPKKMCYILAKSTVLTVRPNNTRD